MLYRIKRIMWNVYFLLALIFGLFVLFGFFAKTNRTANYAFASWMDITVYKTPTCGCCWVYASYIKKNTDANVTVKDLDSLSSIKEKYNIPNKLWSCHTSKVWDKIVEWHIPLEIIKEMFEDDIDARWIAMPGMPSGSPGMPGAKEDFNIFKLKNDGYEFWTTR